MINTTTKIHHKKSTMQRQTKTHVDKKKQTVQAKSREAEMGELMTTS